MANEDDLHEDKKVSRMTFRILKLEQNNLNTREKTNEQMVEAIRKIISEEIKKNY